MSASLLVGLERLVALSKHGSDKSSCPRTMAALTGGLPRKTLVEGAKADVGSLRLNGDRGFLLYHGSRGSSYAMPMVREGGEWKVAALAGAPLTR